MSEVDAAEPLQNDRVINPHAFLSGGGTMLKTICDKKGRIRLSHAVRSKYGEKFYVVEAPGELVLLPVPQDPLKDLEELGKPLRGMSLADIKRAIQEQADKEVSETLDRIGLKKAPQEQELDRSDAGLAGQQRQ